jgi:1-acyl-sn-glycerol-3-phosphate acyltransferase
MTEPEPLTWVFPPEAMARIRAAADKYDPAARQWPLLKALFWLYRSICVGSIHLLGRENIASGPRIIVLNHARVGDPFVLSLILGKNHPLVQAESFTLPILGRLMAGAGWIPVVPGQPRTVLARAMEALQRGETVMITPEGRLSHGGEMLRGQTGAVRLSLRAGVPLQPVAVHVPEKYWRTAHGHFYGRPTIGVWQVGGPTYIAIGEPWRPLEHLDRPPNIAEARKHRRRNGSCSLALEQAQAAATEIRHQDGTSSIGGQADLKAWVPAPPREPRRHFP